MLLFIVTPFALFIVRLLRFVTLPGIITPAEDPPKDKLDVATATKLPGVPAMVGPFNVRVLAPTVKVPAVRVRVPSTETFPDMVLLPLPEIVRL
jgi:hypothetical protein